MGFLKIQLLVLLRHHVVVVQIVFLLHGLPGLHVRERVMVDKAIAHVHYIMPKDSVMDAKAMSKKLSHAVRIRVCRRLMANGAIGVIGLNVVLLVAVVKDHVQDVLHNMLKVVVLQSKLLILSK